MKLHYTMWVTMAVVVFVFTLIFRGQHDMVVNSAKIQGAAMILNKLTPKQLSELEI